MIKNRNLVLSLLSAFLLWVSWSPHYFMSPILLIGFVPLLHLVRINTTKGYGKKVFKYAMLCFFIWNFLITYWVYNAIQAGTGAFIGVFVALLPWAVGALLMSFAWWLYAKANHWLGRLYSYGSLFLFWTGIEWLNQSWDVAFPWLVLGNGFANSVPLIQWYEYTGVYGGSVWILGANILIYESYLNIKTNRKWAFIAISWVLTPMLISLGKYINYTEIINPCNVVVAQPNIDPYDKYTHSPFKTIQALTHLSDSIAQVNTEFFIWPETAIAEYVNEDAIRTSPYYLQIKDLLRNYPNGNVITGIESYQLYATQRSPSASFIPEIKQYMDNFNATVLIDNSDRVQFYHKSLLVPGVEQTPFANGIFNAVFKKLGGATGSYGKQEQPSVLYAQSGLGVAPVICYESIWGNYVRRYIDKEAQFIAIVTNDGWWGNTRGKDQHLAYACLRAIETRRWVARSANTGISAFINQRGDIVQKTEWWTACAIKQDINLNSEKTFYVKHGEWALYLAWVIGFCALGIGLWKRKSS